MSQKAASLNTYLYAEVVEHNFVVQFLVLVDVMFFQTHVALMSDCRTQIRTETNIYNKMS